MTIAHNRFNLDFTVNFSSKSSKIVKKAVPKRFYLTTTPQIGTIFIFGKISFMGGLSVLCGYFQFPIKNLYLKNFKKVLNFIKFT